MYYGYVNVTFRQLQVFEAVARNASYTRAAEELHLSQPAVSMQVKLLEDQVGLPLFEQLGKKIYLTEAGREMHRYSRAIAQQLHEAERVLAELKGVKRGRLSIAVASTANYFATRLLATFSQRYADVSISLDVAHRAGLLRNLDRHGDEQQRSHHTGGRGRPRSRHRLHSHAGTGTGAETVGGAERRGLPHSAPLVSGASPGQAPVAGGADILKIRVERRGPDRTRSRMTRLNF